MEISSSYELLLWLREKGLLRDKPKYWWPNAFSFEVVIGAVLTQNTKWENVKKSLKNLKKEIIITPENIAFLDYGYLAALIKPSGFYNQKAKCLILLSRNILNDFGDFENFRENVNREWLLGQKGVGFETADSILCYACGRDTMVVDSYTKRLLKKYGYEFESYDEMKEWCERGIEEHWEKLAKLYENNLNLCFARFHGKIVEFMKGKK